MAFGSLQKFVGTDTSEKLDSIWNPRNKHLADVEFQADIKDFGCQQSVIGFATLMCAVDALVWEQAKFMHWGVSKFNSKGWPVTEQDLAHVENNYSFEECEYPKVTNVRVSKSAGIFGQSFKVRWTDKSGCIDDIETHSYKICWNVKEFGLRYVKCEYPEGSSLSATLIISKWSWTTVESFKSLAIRPDNLVYGGTILSFDLDSNLEFLTYGRLGRVFYPEQSFNLKH